MRKKNLLVLCIVAAMIAVIAGCAKEETASATAENTETDISEEETKNVEIEEEEPAALTETEENGLYNTYIEINNMMVGRFADVIGRYFEYVDFQEEFVPLRDSFSLYSVISTFYDNMDTADELVEMKAEKTDVDKAYEALSPVMRELAQALDDMEGYMESEQYLEDDFAKAKEYHAVIWKAYADYDVLSIDFIDKLGAVASLKQEEDMATLKEEGYEVTYALVSMIQTAQDLQNAIYDQGIMEDSQMLELDVEKIQPLCDQYLEQVETAIGYLEDEEAVVNEGYPVNSAYFATFTQAVKMSGEELKAILQRVEDQEPIGPVNIVNAYTVSGTIAGFDSKVSAMINDYNQMLNY